MLKFESRKKTSIADKLNGRWLRIFLKTLNNNSVSAGKSSWSWAWHSSAPACIIILMLSSFSSHLRYLRTLTRVLSGYFHTWVILYCKSQLAQAWGAVLLIRALQIFCPRNIAKISKTDNYLKCEILIVTFSGKFCEQFLWPFNEFFFIRWKNKCKIWRYVKKLIITTGN